MIGKFTTDPELYKTHMPAESAVTSWVGPGFIPIPMCKDCAYYKPWRFFPIFGKPNPKLSGCARPQGTKTNLVDGTSSTPQRFCSTERQSWPFNLEEIKDENDEFKYCGEIGRFYRYKNST